LAGPVPDNWPDNWPDNFLGFVPATRQSLQLRLTPRYSPCSPVDTARAFAVHTALV
jgi:hypothetical protein